MFWKRLKKEKQFLKNNHLKLKKMNLININPAPAVSMRTPKKSSEFFWFSETDTINSQDKKNTKIKKSLKKKKKND